MHAAEAERTFQPQAVRFVAKRSGVEACVLGASAGATLGGGHAVATALGDHEGFGLRSRDAVLRGAVADGAGHGEGNVVKTTPILRYRRSKSKKNHARWNRKEGEMSRLRQGGSNHGGLYKENQEAEA